MTPYAIRLNKVRNPNDLISLFTVLSANKDLRVKYIMTRKVETVNTLYRSLNTYATSLIGYSDFTFMGVL